MSSEPRTIPPPQVGGLLRMAWEALQADMYAGLVAAGYDDLRPMHQRLMRYVLMYGLRPGELAIRLDLSKQAVNDLLRDFEAKGYLTLEPDPDDGRAKRIHLTERGWGLATTASNLSRDVGRRWAKVVGKKRFAEFEAVLREIVAAEEVRRPAP